MAKKKVIGFAKLQIPAGKAAWHPVSPALGQHGVNIAFCKEFNGRTAGGGRSSSGDNCIRGSLLYFYHQKPSSRCC